MKHVEKALEKLKQDNLHFGKYDDFIKIEPSENPNEGHKVTFIIQNGPVKEVGLNGVQATDMLEYIKFLFHNLNQTFSCRENSLTITKIEEALHWQWARDKDRNNRNVEGYEKP